MRQRKQFVLSRQTRMSSGYGNCCPAVVDPLTYLAFLSFLAAAVYLLNEQIQMSMLMMAKRRKKRNTISDIWTEGNSFHKLQSHLHPISLVVFQL